MTNIEIKNYNFPDINSETKFALQSAASEVLQSIKAKNPAYQIFSIQHAEKQAKAVEVHVREIKDKFSDLIVIGMGGSILNPRLLVSLAGSHKSSLNIYFLDNTDPIFLNNLLSKISLKSTAIITISNSGNTLETISLAGVMIAEFEKASIQNFGKHFYFITNPRAGVLKDVAQNISATLITHTEGISGRYSGLTNVTSFVAQLAEIDVNGYFLGAKAILDDFLERKLESQVALSAAAIYSVQKPIAVNIGYLQNFATFLEWHSQIISESLGKDGIGITPLKGLGPNDQHSMLQLYLDGPQDKIYSLFYVKNIKSDLIIPVDKEFDYIAGKNLSDINSANFEATLKALIEAGLPTRSLILQDLSAQNIGLLVVHSMLEVIILGHMMKINPFNQPGVEKIKKEATRIIKG
jgi:glucose-6-phosphate isomerase